MFDHLRFLFKRKKAFYALIEECADYLAPGEYYVEREFGKFVLKKGRFPLHRLNHLYLQQIICGTYRVKGKENKYNCNIALLSPFFNYKMFDEAGGRTYTKFSDAYWPDICLYYENMAPYFQTLILSLDRENHILVERIAKVEELRDERKCFFDFCAAFLQYSDTAAWVGTMSVKQVKKELDAQPLHPEVRRYVDYIEEHVMDDTGEYPVIVCHNDVNVDNVLTEDNITFSLIDFELCDNNAFFFDVLGLIFNSAVFLGDDTLFVGYVNGEFDEQLGCLFGKFGMKYVRTERLRYLYLFLYFKIFLVFRLSREFLPMYAKKIWKFSDYLSDNGLID